jgi:hypothetical protein
MTEDTKKLTDRLDQILVEMEEAKEDMENKWRVLVCILIIGFIFQGCR